VAGVVSSALATTLLALALTPVSAFAQPDFVGDWIVNVWGSTVHKTTRIGTDPETEFHSLGITNTEGQAKFIFAIASDGSIVDGGGNGIYFPDPTWHLEGSYDGVAFDCDPPVVAESFGTTITGTATESAFTFTLDFPDAREHNDDMECSENFSAFATDTQDLRESLQFCGDVRLASAEYAETSCRKSQIFFESMSSPTQGRIKREITHEWFLVLRKRGPGTESPNPTPSGSTDPSPSPTPEPQPPPTDTGPSTNARRSLMILERHLNASGAVTLAGWGDPDCVVSVPVRIQRQRPDGSWVTVATVTTNEAGQWSRGLGDRKGRYRALAPDVTKGQATCTQAASGIKRHRHRS
jgi:hypothetical protein